MSKANRRDLPKYLYYYPSRKCFRFKLPGMDKFRYLPKDLSQAEAILLFNEIRADYAERSADVGNRFSDYATEWRKTMCPRLVKKRAKTPVSDSVKAEYARMCQREVEASPLLAVTPDKVSTKVVHQFLAPFLDRPAQYNRLRVVMGHIFRMCVRKGVAEHNPMLLVESEPTPVREVYLPHEHFARIRTAGVNEWDARAFDLLYFVSGRPSSVLAIRESDIADGVLSYDESKVRQGVDLTMNPVLQETVEWFREQKRVAGVISPLLLVYLAPWLSSRHRRYHGLPVTEEYVSKHFARAVVRAGFSKSEYRLYDLRKKGINDEVLTGGEQNKGAHLDVRTRNTHYTPLKPRIKVTTTLGRVN